MGHALMENRNGGIRQNQPVNGEMPGPTEVNPNDERFTIPRNSLFGYHRGRIWEPYGECQLNSHF
jgi:hypothetical protein